MKSIQLFVLFISTTAMFACGKKSDNQVIPPSPADKITSLQWCMPSGSEGIVTRMSFSPTKETKFDYLKIEHTYPKKRVTVYPATSPKATQWTKKASVDAPNSVGMFSLYLVENPTGPDLLKLQNKLYDLGGLARDFGVTTTDGKYVPKTALVVGVDDLFTMNQSSVAVPCEEISPALIAQDPKRPSIELQVLRNQQSWSTYSAGILSITMRAKEPINLYKISKEELTTTSWCSWFQTSNSDSFLLYLMTFGSEKVNFSTETDYVMIDMFNDSTRRERALKLMADPVGHRQDPYSFNSAGQVITKTKLDFSTLEFENTYTPITDGNGTKILVEAKPAMFSYISFQDLFFDCNDERPLKEIENLKLEAISAAAKISRTFSDK